MNTAILVDAGLLERWNGTPSIDLAANLREALRGGCRAFTDRGPVLLEVNDGGDLNLAQLACRAGVLDEIYAEHLRQNGHRF